MAIEAQVTSYFSHCNNLLSKTFWLKLDSLVYAMINWKENTADFLFKIKSQKKAFEWINTISYRNVKITWLNMYDAVLQFQASKCHSCYRSLFQFEQVIVNGVAAMSLAD